MLNIIQGPKLGYSESRGCRVKSRDILLNRKKGQTGALADSYRLHHHSTASIVHCCNAKAEQSP